MQQNKANDSHISYLDGWRGVAILFVLIGHFFPVTKFIYLGRFGVEVFFVLSGLLMSRILFEYKVPLGKFYKRRISRIFPLFFVYVTVLYGLDFIYLKTGEHTNYLYTLFFLRTYLPGSDIWASPLPIGHLWSLNIEEHSYILLSILTLSAVFTKRVGFLLISFSVGCVVIHYFYVKGGYFKDFNVNARTETAAASLFASAGYYWIVQKYNLSVHRTIPLFSFCIAMFFYTKWAPHWALSWALTPFLLAVSVNHLKDASNYVKKILSGRYICWLGMFSYSIYVWQQPLYKLLHSKYLMIYNPYLVGVLFFFTACFFGYLSFLFIERPIREKLNENW